MPRPAQARTASIGRHHCRPHLRGRVAAYEVKATTARLAFQGVVTDNRNPPVMGTAPAAHCRLPAILDRLTCGLITPVLRTVVNSA